MTKTEFYDVEGIIFDAIRQSEKLTGKICNSLNDSWWKRDTMTSWVESWECAETIEYQDAHDVFVERMMEQLSILRGKD